MSHPVYGLNELREMFLKFFESKGSPASAQLFSDSPE